MSRIFGSFLFSANQTGSRRPCSAATHSRAWLIAENSSAGRAPSGTLRAFSVILIARIGRPSSVTPSVSSFMTSGLAAAVARISSAMPPGSEYERQTLKNGFGLSPLARFFACGGSIGTAVGLDARASSVAASLGDRYTASSWLDVSPLS